MEKDYYRYLDASEANFKLPIRKDNYSAINSNPFNCIETDTEGTLSIDIDKLSTMVCSDKENSGLDNYTFYNFEDFFDGLIDINMLDSYDYDSEDLKALYSCVMENIKEVKE